MFNSTNTINANIPDINIYATSTTNTNTFSINTLNISTFDTNTYVTSIANINIFNTNTLNTNISNVSILSISISGIKTHNTNIPNTSIWIEKITKLLKKDVSKVIILKEFVTFNKAVIFKEISSNIKVFSFCFVHEIKNPGIYKAYKKSCLILKTDNDKNKNFELM